VCTEALSQFSYVQNGAVIQFTSLNTWATSYLWDFGDGTFSTQQNPVKAFTMGGQHMVCVTVTDSCGPGTTCENFTICLPPQPAYTHVPTGLSVQFTAANQNALSYKWEFGNLSFSKNPLYTYPSPGTYTACITVVDSCGEYTSCQNITVSGIGIVENNSKMAMVYPNPTTGILHIETTSKALKSIGLYTLAGKKLKNVDAASIEVDLSDLN
jgi:PKD repeat protein